jgi:ubiquinone/menaquinone biosynthesis C-methylase UbiE
MRRLWWGFLRFAFRLFYNQFAWTYDFVAWVVSLGQWKAWGRTTIPHLRGERVLELAHGPGHLLVAMAGQGLSPVGLDLSPYMARLTRRQLRKAGLTVPLVRARAQALPFQDGCFDSAVATFPAEFIVAQATLRETARVLEPDGKLVVALGALPGRRGPIPSFIRWLYRITEQRDMLPKGGEALLRRAGFSPRVQWETVGQSRVLLVTSEKGQ